MRPRGGAAKRLDDRAHGAGDAERGLVLVVHGEAADEGGGELGGLGGGGGAEDEGVEAGDEAGDGSQGLLEVGVEGEMEEDGEGEGEGGLGVGESEEEGKSVLGVGEEVSVVAAEPGEGREGGEGGGPSFHRVRPGLSKAFGDGGVHGLGWHCWASAVWLRFGCRLLKTEEWSGCR